MGSFSRTITHEFEDVTSDIADIIEDEVNNLHNDLIDVGQDVWLSGEFKNSFAPWKKLDDFVWIIENDADHAGILARGRRLVGGRWYGSEKWSQGLDPMIEAMNNKVERRVNDL